MDQKEINITIAEWMGYQYYQSGGHVIWLLKEKPANPLFRIVERPEELSELALKEVPNFCGDLNAIHKAEKVLIKKDKEFKFSSKSTDYPSCRYISNLNKIVDVKFRSETVNSGLKKPDSSNLILEISIYASPFEEIKIAHATAIQRAEALFQTIKNTP